MTWKAFTTIATIHSPAVTSTNRKRRLSSRFSVLFFGHRKPYGYVPVSDAAYQARLADIATQIVNDLHSPDILMVQEVENQDFCTVTGGVLTPGITDNADGKPDVLQELALKIAVSWRSCLRCRLGSRQL